MLFALHSDKECRVWQKGLQSVIGCWVTTRDKSMLQNTVDIELQQILITWITRFNKMITKCDGKGNTKCNGTWR